MTRPPDDIIVWALTAVTGEVTPNMRMIVLGYDPAHVTFRFYMSEAPSADEREIGEIVAVNFESGHPTKLERVGVKFVVTDEPLGKLEPLDFCLFARWEEPH